MYQPHFTVIRAETDPKLGLSGFASTPGESLEGVNVENYPLPRWRAANGNGMTDIVYEAGSVTEIRATDSRALDDGGMAWTFESNPHFTLEAEVRPVSGEPPRISWKFTARTPGWYTVGYTGGPASDPATVDGFLQPLIWQEKRFPRAPLLSAESMGGLPLTLVTRDGVTHGLSVDPRESPYRLPTIANARFGVMLRNPKGEAQPSAFAPLLGQTDSRFEAGQSATFSVRPLLVSGDWYQAFTEVARSLFGFADTRQNAGQSLNATIDTMTEFAMDDAHSGWDADLRGFDYNTDVKGTVKVVSALHPLAASLVQDDPEIYRLRALPITEFLMSRTKYLYNALPDEAGQNAARDMKGPAAEVSELAELYQMSREQSPVFRHYALQLAGKPRQLNLLMVSDGATFWDKLALYRLTGDKATLAEARSLADAYIKTRIDTPQRDFSDVHLDRGGQFWSDFAPRFVELFELWQETKEPRYLNAALTGARSVRELCLVLPDDAEGGDHGWLDRVGTLRAWQAGRHHSRSRRSAGGPYRHGKSRLRDEGRTNISGRPVRRESSSVGFQSANPQSDLTRAPSPTRFAPPRRPWPSEQQFDRHRTDHHENPEEPEERRHPPPAVTNRRRQCSSQSRSPERQAFLMPANGASTNRCRPSPMPSTR